MFEKQIGILYAEFQEALARGDKLSVRQYLESVFELRDELDRLVLPQLGVDSANLATQNIMRFKGYGPGNLMPNSGVRGMVPMGVDNTHGPDYEPHWILLQRRGDGGEWGIPSGFVNADDTDEASAFIREAREELGITITGIEMIARTSNLARCTHTYPNGDRIIGRDNLYRVISYEGNPNLTRDTEQEGLELNSLI
ncbi:NUDIX hydrolase [Candidatus Woesearchaeota archaeon]|nr:NUDIX hydrolase [Candidatus Woesearchaeota archaeon]